MKLRVGFVSNSSSTSFVMYGINIPEGELFPGDDNWTKEEEGYNKAEDLGLDMHHAGEEGWGYYIGKDFMESKYGEIDLDGVQVNGESGLEKDIVAKVEEFLKAVGYKGYYKFGIYAKTYAS